MPVENDIIKAKGGVVLGTAESPPAELAAGVLKESQIPPTLEKISSAEASYVSRSTTALNLQRDFTGIGDCEQVSVTLNATTTVEVSSAKSSWVGKVICGEGIQRGTTVSTAVNGATSIVVSKAASTSGSKTINIGTDNSSAFENFWTAANEKSKLPPFINGDNNKIFQSEIYLPPGKYIVTKPKSVMNSSITAIKGIKITGSGKESTTIIFAPSEENASLMKNNQALFQVTFEHLTFSSLDSTATWFESVGPTAQNYTCMCVNWRGEWKYGYKLSGTNNNSEFTHLACGIYGSWTAFLYSPSEAEGGSDQFLNYWFFGCSVITTKGNFVDMASGGAIDCVGGNYILNGNGSEEQTLFRLRTEVHGPGVTRLNVDGVRSELRHAQAKIIDSEWKTGIISFKSWDGGTVNEARLPLTTSVTTKTTSIVTVGTTSIPVESSTGFELGMQVQIQPANAEKQEVVTIAEVPDGTHIVTNALGIEHSSGIVVQKATRPNAVQARFRGIKDLIVKWDVCQLAGVHQYDIVVSSYEYHRSVDYQSCGIVDHAEAQTFIYNTPNGNSVAGNRVPIAFDDKCKGSSTTLGYHHPFGCVVNWDRATNGRPQHRQVSIKNTSTGCLPSTASGNTSETITLPSHSVITRVRSWKGTTGSLEATNWEYKLTDEANSGAEILSIKPGQGGIPEGQKWKEGWNYDSGALFLRAKELPSEGWTIKLAETNVTQQQEESFVIVEYLA